VSDQPAALPPSRGSLILSRVLRRIAFYPFLIASLLVFPAWLPYMALGWLGLAYYRQWKQQPVWPPLALAAGLILVKRVDWAPGLDLFLIGLVVAAALDAIHRRKPVFRRPAAIALGSLIGLWMIFLIVWQQGGHTNRHPTLVADRPVVLIGDSLMSGGVARVLQPRLKVPVVDLSQGGITTADGVKLIPELEKAQPQAVVIELGGHDSLRGRSRSEAKANLERIIDAAVKSGATVLLFEIPLGFISDPYAGLQRELARQYDLELISDGAIRQLVYFSPFTPLGRWTGRMLSYDGLHPNDAGNVFLADRTEAALVRVYGPAIRR
jgi:acyl-CoA thioesterase I